MRIKGGGVVFLVVPYVKLGWTYCKYHYINGETLGAHIS